MFPCISGEHYWTREDDAQKCCNGYVRILVLSGADDAQVIAGVIAGRAWVKHEAVVAQQGYGADPNCRNCEGAGAALDDGSCRQCWCEVDADTAVVVVLSDQAVRQYMGGADPDRVQHIGQGVYEAIWLPGRFDLVQLESLRAAPGVTNLTEPDRLEHSPDWTVIRFRLDAVGLT